eukprot:5837247-Amphidinium_carterae.1
MRMVGLRQAGLDAAWSLVLSIAELLAVFGSSIPVLAVLLVCTLVVNNYLFFGEAKLVSGSGGSLAEDSCNNKDAF